MMDHCGSSLLLEDREEEKSGFINIEIRAESLFQVNLI